VYNTILTGRVLTQVQVDKLMTALQTVLTLLADVRATLNLTVIDLTPAVVTSLGGEVDAVQAVLTPFIIPLGVLVTTVQEAQASATLTISGLAALMAGVEASTQGILDLIAFASTIVLVYR
jgi:hypothetical protein